MDYRHTPYFSVGRASDLTGSDRILYRFLEMFPGLLAWTTILGTIIASFLVPVWAAYFIIAFDLYWLLKNAYLSIHLRHNWKRIKYNLSLDWKEMLSNLKYEHILHVVILPYYTESLEVVEQSVKALAEVRYDKKKIAVVLASEMSAGEAALKIAHIVQNKYGHLFGHFLVTRHPVGVLGEMSGKGSNISFAAEETRVKILDLNHFDYKNVLVSAFDIDTVAYPDYFLCLTWHFLTVPDPQKVSFQPVPFYNNNIWHVPALSRVVAASSTFWQMIQQERPEKLATFSSFLLPSQLSF